jgi:hypothetical protein
MFPDAHRSVDLGADDGISDAHSVADPHGVNPARWCTLCGRVLYARNGTLRMLSRLAGVMVVGRVGTPRDRRVGALGPVVSPSLGAASRAKCSTRPERRVAGAP